jgi:toxin-antitoxin system PIN domain toxin
VILVDVNLLIFATNPELQEYAVARPWLEARMAGHERVGLAWVTILAFVRLQSNPRIVSRSVAPIEAWTFLQDEWLSRPNVWIPGPAESHIEILTTLFSTFAKTQRKVTDAHLAAIAIEHGLTLCSADNDFATVPGLQWMNPLRQNTLHERPPLPWMTTTKTGTPSSRKPRR